MDCRSCRPLAATSRLAAARALGRGARHRHGARRPGHQPWTGRGHPAPRTLYREAECHSTSR
jgi:hypothetical protein